MGSLEAGIGSAGASERPCRVAVGDLWALGRHRLICGDSTCPAVIGRLLAQGREAQALSAIERWNDESGNGNHFRQANPGNRPTVRGFDAAGGLIREVGPIGGVRDPTSLAGGPVGAGCTARPSSEILAGRTAVSSSLCGSASGKSEPNRDAPIYSCDPPAVDVVFADPPYGLGLRYGRAKERVVGDGSASGRFVEAALGIPARDWWVCASPMMIAPAISAFERTGLCRKCGGRILGTNWFVPPRFGNCCNHGVKWGDPAPRPPDASTGPPMDAGARAANNAEIDAYRMGAGLVIPQDDRTFGELMDRAICGSCGRKAASRDLVGFDGLITWDKGRAGLGFMAVRRQTEFLIYRSRRRHKRGDRSESDLWRIQAGPIGCPMKHPSEKPIELVMRALRFSMDVAADSSVPARGEGFATVCDPFAGSGTTILAAEALGMQCLAAEICPEHCAGILGRWEAETGIPAVKVFS